MARELFRIPFLDLPVWGYGAMVLLGFLSANWLFLRGARRAGIEVEKIQDMPLVLVLCGLGGGRLFYVIQFWERDFAGQGWLEPFKIWNGGLVLYGAIVVGLLSFFLICLRKSLEWRQVLDLIAPALAVGIGFGRVGCFLNGCCWGDSCAVDFPLAVVFPPGSPPAFANGIPGGPSFPLHPTQLYSAAQGFILALLLWRISPLLAGRPGRAFGLLMALYAVGRWTLESVRADHAITAGDWTVSQGISLGFLVCGGILWILAPRRGNSSSAAPQEGSL